MSDSSPKNSTQKQLDVLKQAIEAQETLRDTLGDAVVDATITTLQDQLRRMQPALSDERKLITILFCDIVGSTRIARDRDPEEVLGIIDGALKEMASAIERYDGFVSRYMGDGILALFGAPKALEGHAEQAILAGLEIQSRIQDYSVALSKRSVLETFQVRVGINTGYVVAGQVAGASGEYTVIGDAVNIASRIESAAPPGGVLIGASAYDLSGGDNRFKTEAWEPIQVKGASQPIQVFQVFGFKERTTRRIPRTSIRAPLTGRDQEIAKLQTHFKQMLAEGGIHVGILTGPAGVGKSRLRQEFLDWAATEYPSLNILMGRTFSYESHTPYWIIRDLLRRVMKIHEGDQADRRREKLESALSDLDGQSPETAQGLAAILAVDSLVGDLSQLDPQDFRDAIFSSCCTFIGHQSEENKLLLVLEDTHWIDEISMDLLIHLVKVLANDSIYILILTRPDPEQLAKWEAASASLPNRRLETLTLADLSQGSTIELIQGLLKTKDVPKDLLRLISEKSQGNPFFAEEIVNTLIQHEYLQLRDRAWQLTGNISDIQVPDTVQGVLAARVDRLNQSEKQVIQHAAIIGRTFSEKLLSDLVQQDIEPNLSGLTEKEFIQLFEGSGGFVEDDQDWIFRHVLVQEVTYESVLREKRRQVHRLIAGWLEENSADRLEELAPTLARHYEYGQDWEKAVHYLTLAADRSMNLFALREAREFYSRAISLGEQYPQELKKEAMLHLLEKRGEVLGMLGDFKVAAADLELALIAVQETGDLESQQHMLVQLGMVYRRADDYAPAKLYLEKALEAARERGDLHSVADVLYHIGSVVWSEGYNIESEQYHKEALEIVRELGLKDLVAVQATHGRAENYWVHGQINKALLLFEESYNLALSVGDKSYEVENLQMLCIANCSMAGSGENQKGLEYGFQALEISRAAGLDWHTMGTLNSLAGCHAGLGNYQKSIKYALEAIQMGETLGANRFMAGVYIILGVVYRELNLLKLSEETIQLGLEVHAQIGSKFFLLLVQGQWAQTRVAQGDREIQPFLEELLKESRALGHGAQRFDSLLPLAQLAIEDNRIEHALKYVNEAMEIATSGGMRGREAESLHYLVAVHIAEGNFPEAKKALERAAALAEALGSPRLRWDVAERWRQLHLARGEEDLADQRRQEIEKIKQAIVDSLTDPDLKVGLLAGG